MTESRAIEKKQLPIQRYHDESTNNTDETIALLRRFHLGDQSVRSQLPPLQAPGIPALLYPYYGNKLVRSKYPLFLSPSLTDSDDFAIQALSEKLSALCQQIADKKPATTLLKDNLLRFEIQLRTLMAEQKEPVLAKPLFKSASNELLKHLALPAETETQLKEQLINLTEALAGKSTLLEYGPLSALHLFLHLVEQDYQPRLSQFKDELKILVDKLQALQELQKHRSGADANPQAIKNSLGTVGASLFDTDALSSVIKNTEASTPPSDEDCQRLSRTLNTILSYLEDDSWQTTTLLHNRSQGIKTSAAIDIITSANPCLDSTALFDKKAERLTEVFRAARIARLEIAGEYQPDSHDPWFDNFNWESFSKAELLLLPPLIAIEDADLIAAEGMQSFSQSLCSGRPIHILVEVSPSRHHGSEKQQEAINSFRLELAYLAISHRRALVSQSSAAYPEHLLKGFRQALQSTRTSVHIISTIAPSITDNIALQDWLIDGAAIESRAHPLLCFNPQAGSSWAEQMDLSLNPSAKIRWSKDEFHFRRQSDGGTEKVCTEKLAFTFADYALLDPAYQSFFLPIPDGVSSDDLVLFQDYMSSQRPQRERLIPYLYAVNEEGELQRLVVARILKLACKDRQRYWHTLQELAGINNRHVALALEQTAQDTKADIKQQIQQLEMQHADALEQVRLDTAREAMQRLARVLTSTEIDKSFAGLLNSGNQQDLIDTPQVIDSKKDNGADEVLVEVNKVNIIATDAEKVAETETPASAAVVEAEIETESTEEEPEEAWIYSDLCTSCNDCFQISSSLFAYDENKQAFINDPEGGSFEQLVKAAELCPAQCIHPGSPLNPDEAGLEDLIRRASPFNQP